MEKFELPQDPYNLIITGVGGQGNVLGSRIIGTMLSMNGFQITIGETFGASQRGGSVMSHMRISKASNYSPQIPKGKAHMIVALEPLEAVRVLNDYGNEAVKTICNLKPLHPANVIAGNVNYPSMDDIQTWVNELSEKAWFLDSTEEAMKLGNAIFGNIIMAGALSATDDLPLNREDFKSIIEKQFTPDKAEVNMEAFDIGYNLVSN